MGGTMILFVVYICILLFLVSVGLGVGRHAVAIEDKTATRGKYTDSIEYLKTLTPNQLTRRQQADWERRFAEATRTEHTYGDDLLSTYGIGVDPSYWDRHTSVDSIMEKAWSEYGVEATQTRVLDAYFKNKITRDVALEALQALDKHRIIR
jgi:hypothetical protein